MPVEWGEVHYLLLYCPKNKPPFKLKKHFLKCFYVIMFLFQFIQFTF